MAEQHDHEAHDVSAADGAPQRGQSDDRSSEEFAVSSNIANGSEESPTSESGAGPTAVNGASASPNREPETSEGAAASEGAGHVASADTEHVDSGHASEDAAESESSAEDSTTVVRPTAFQRDPAGSDHEHADSSADWSDTDSTGDDEPAEDEVADMAALRSDDALLDALGGTDPQPGADSASNLDSLLVAWRREIDAEPIGDLVGVDAAAAAISAGRRPARRRPRFLVPMASAAAVLVIAFTGMGLAARDALPGDALWGVTQVLYSDHASSVQAASSAEHNLDQAQQAFQKGKSRQAQKAMRQAEEQMRRVAAEDGRKRLQATHQSLSNRYPEQPPGSTGTSSSQRTSSSRPPLPPPPAPTSSQPAPTTSMEPTTPSGPPTSTQPQVPPTTSGGSSSGPTTTSGPTSSPWAPTTGSSGSGGGLWSPGMSSHKPPSSGR